MKNLFPDIEWRWFYNTALITVILAIAYLIPHLIWEGKEAVYLTKEQLTAVNTILAQDTITTPGDTVRLQFNAYLSRVLDKSEPKGSGNLITEQLRALNLFSNRELPAILPTYPFYIVSPFWLFGGWVFLELVFWSLFGVAANVIYRVSEAMCDGTFDQNKIPIHLAKLIYAPLSTIVIFLSIEVFSQGGSITLDDLTSSTIVLAFMLGFFSGRTVELLRRLKNVILPLGGSPEEGGTHDGINRSDSEVKFGSIQGAISFGVSNQVGENFDYSGIAIQLYSANDVFFQRQIMASVDGKFAFNDIPTGQYELRAETSLADKPFLATRITDLTEGGASIDLTLTAYSDFTYNMIVK